MWFQPVAEVHSSSICATMSIQTLQSYTVTT